jgi:hypothetical protein
VLSKPTISKAQRFFEGVGGDIFGSSKLSGRYRSFFFREERVGGISIGLFKLKRLSPFEDFLFN